LVQKILCKEIQRRPGADVLPLDKNSVKTRPSGGIGSIGRRWHCTPLRRSAGMRVGVWGVRSGLPSTSAGRHRCVFQNERCTSTAGNTWLSPHCPPLPDAWPPISRSPSRSSPLPIRAHRPTDGRTPPRFARAAPTEARNRRRCFAFSSPMTSGSSSVGRASASHAEGRGFDPRLPLHLRVWNVELGVPNSPSLHIPQSQLPTRPCPGG
jgi:hypothetical protein